MPEPASSGAATIAAASVAVPALTAFGVPLGLRPDVLIAGFAGSLVAITLLDSVPSTGDTVRELLRTSGRRMAVSCAGALTAGYLTPMLLLLASLPDALLLGAAFAIGGSAQQALRRVIARVYGAEGSAP